MDREAAEKALIKLARQTATTWRCIRGEAFLGETTIETANTVYRFENAVFSGRARRVAGVATPAWESPPNMKGVELVGFLADEGGLWSLSARWRPGALAVITTNDRAFTLTSPTFACTIERPARRSRPELLDSARADVFMASPPPTVRRPAPPSMTRLQPAPLR